MHGAIKTPAEGAFECQLHGAIEKDQSGKPFQCQLPEARKRLWASLIVQLVKNPLAMQDSSSTIFLVPEAANIPAHLMSPGCL